MSSSNNVEQYRVPGEHRGNQNARQRANNLARAAAVGMRENITRNTVSFRPQPSPEEYRVPGEHRGNQNARQRANNLARAAAVGMKENLRSRGGKRKTRKTHRKTRKGTRRS